MLDFYLLCITDLPINNDNFLSTSTGSGDIDTSKVVKANADGCTSGASG